MKISVVLPVYNEEKIIKSSIRTLKEYLSQNFDAFEIIVVNDGSSDKSGEILKNISGIKLISLTQNRGKGYAVKRGVDSSGGDIVVFTDADLCCGVKNIKPLTENIKNAQNLKNFDISIACRDKNRTGYSALRRIFSHTFDVIAAPFLGRITDVQCGMKAFSKSAARAIFPHVKTSGFAFDFEILYLARQFGFEISETPVTMKTTEKSAKSTVNLVRDPFFMLFDIFKIVFRTFTKNSDFKDEFADEKTNL